MKRPHRIAVTLTDAELARLDEMRHESQSRPAYLRSLILGSRSEVAGIADHDESLSILSRAARDGKVAAAIALERALREATPPASEMSPEDELDGILGA